MGTFISRIQLWWKKKNFLKCLEEEALDLSLELLLQFMRLYCIVNKPFRRNIDHFNARYTFKSVNQRIDVGVVFSEGTMTVYNHPVDNTDITVVFKDGKALREFLFSDNPDVIGAILNGDVSYTGNLNYLSKFAYMAKSMKLQLLPA